MAHGVPAIATDTSRIQSIDIFRGLTVLVMVFVDNLGMVKGLPWWTYHKPPNTNGMTYVDMVFPAFLFLAGMAIPLSVERRLARGDSTGKVWMHVLGRSFTLVILGLFIANAPQIDARSAGLNAIAWTSAAFLAIGLALNVYPSPSRYKTLFRILRFAGYSLLLSLLAIFKRTTPDGHVAWLDFSDWEILGLIGWAYLLASTIYLLLGKKVWALLASFVVLLTVNVFSTIGWLRWLDQFPVFLRPFEAGLGSLTMAGVIAARVFLQSNIANTLQRRTLQVLGYAACLAIAARILAPLGISKLRDTPAWCLYCAAASILIFVLLYWIADVKQKTAWTVPFRRPAGTNALLPYLLAYVAYFTPQLGMLTADGTAGSPGVLKALFFTTLVLAVSALLTRFGIQLQL